MTHVVWLILNKTLKKETIFRRYSQIFTGYDYITDKLSLLSSHVFCLTWHCSIRTLSRVLKGLDFGVVGIPYSDQDITFKLICDIKYNMSSRKIGKPLSLKKFTFWTSSDFLGEPYREIASKIWATKNGNFELHHIFLITTVWYLNVRRENGRFLTDQKSSIFKNWLCREEPN